MATIKSYTDLEQSKKLAEILPLESADMCYTKDKTYPRIITKEDITYAKVLYDSSYNTRCFKIFEETPCWSLATLIEFLPNIIVIDGCKWGLSIRKDGISYLGSMTLDGQLHKSVQSDNLVDACYEMIIKLNEQNLLVK